MCYTYLGRYFQGEKTMTGKITCELKLTKNGEMYVERTHADLGQKMSDVRIWANKIVWPFPGMPRTIDGIVSDMEGWGVDEKTITDLIQHGMQNGYIEEIQSGSVRRYRYIDRRC